MAAACPAMRSMSPGARFKGYSSWLSQLPLRKFPENFTQHFLPTCLGQHYCKGKLEVCFSFFFSSWQIAYLPKYGGFVSEEERKNRFWIFISTLCHKPPQPFFSLLFQWCRIKWQIETHFCFLIIVLIKWPFHSAPKAAHFRMSRQNLKKRNLENSES